MAATSAAHTASALTPPSSSHGDTNGFQWDFNNLQNPRDEVSVVYSREPSHTAIVKWLTSCVPLPLPAEPPLRIQILAQA